ncbi:MAG: DUF368 domain-containing protein [bacterium]
MKPRQLKDYFIISLKGIAMGAADAVPGVSGGTIAFISGIYEELITSISNVDASLFKTLFKEGFAAFWKKANGNFLLALIIGIAVSLISFTRLAKYLLENHPILIWAFFFGLILASVLIVGKQIKKWNPANIIALVVGTLVAYYISGLPSMMENDSTLFLFFAGSLAICAMILPGVSGAFILVILGAYKNAIDALHDFDIKKIVTLSAGALLGLLTFSRVLKWLFKKYRDLTLALLTGFIIGSLNKVWPWKKVLTFRTNSKGKEVPLLEESISPFNFDGDPQLLWAILLMIVGFFTIYLLEKFGPENQ